MSGPTLTEVIDQLQQLYLSEKARVLELEAENAKLKAGILEEAYGLSGCKHANTLYAYCLACKLESAEAERDRLQKRLDNLRDEVPFQRLLAERACMQRDLLAALAGRDKLRDTVERIAVEMPTVSPDSGKCDSIGEIYHLLRECGAMKE